MTPLHDVYTMKDLLLDRVTIWLHNSVLLYGLYSNMVTYGTQAGWPYNRKLTLGHLYYTCIQGLQFFAMAILSLKITWGINIVESVWQV